MKMIRSARNKRTKVVRQYKAVKSPQLLVLSETRQKAIRAYWWHRVSQVTLVASATFFIIALATAVL